MTPRGAAPMRVRKIRADTWLQAEDRVNRAKPGTYEVYVMGAFAYRVTV